MGVRGVGVRGLGMRGVGRGTLPEASASCSRSLEVDGRRERSAEAGAAGVDAAAAVDAVSGRDVDAVLLPPHVPSVPTPMPPSARPPAPPLHSDMPPQEARRARSVAQEEF